MRRLSLLFAALAIAGCGGSSSTEETASGPPLSKSSFIKQADAICAEYHSRKAALDQEIGRLFSARNFDAAAKALQDEIDAGRKEVEKLRALSPPEADAETLGTLVDDLEKVFDVAEQAKGSLADGEVSDYLETGREAAEPSKEASEIAKQYGFKVCGQD